MILIVLHQIRISTINVSTVTIVAKIFQNLNSLNQLGHTLSPKPDNNQSLARGRYIPELKLFSN